MTDIVGSNDLTAITPASTSTGECSHAGAGVTVATFNLLGAGHTDKNAAGGSTRPDFPTWKKRLPGAMTALQSAGVSIAALQEVHPPQAKALAGDYAGTWGMFPLDGDAQNRVIWDSTAWTLTTGQLVQIPYFDGKEVGMPLVQLTSTTTGQSIWVWSIHNPADAYGNAAALRAEALRRQHATLSDLAAAGTPVVIAGDFNDARDGNGSSHCQLTPTLTNAFGGSVDPCTEPTEDAAVDHIYGANLSWASARVDSSVQTAKISDHPLVVATTASNNTACTMQPAGYNLGPVQPQLARLVGVLGPMFGIQNVGGYRESAHDPNGHPSGLAADFMVPLTAAGKQQGNALADYARSHAVQLGIDYIIWYQRIWSADRAGEGWRPMEDRGNDTENHRDHVHINALPAAAVDSTADVTQGCSEVVYPVPEQYVGSDQHNWHSSGSSWSSWHTGTDFSMPCGTPVYAAHAGTIEIDTTQSWAGPYLVKITTGATSLATWYAHMETVTVSRAQTVAAGDQIGTTGDLGNSRGCHLHFEVHLENGSIYGPDNVDPSGWLAENAKGDVTARTARRDVGGQEEHNHAA
ncbi:peptidoglycan DD-metalloendopeptidase family protein [Nocardioides sp. InS609-2]|uniref:peptidoglycan DD-metalloendopeptidase family protein n=1 Tax=Nocardioides sp. InS609-2 TaxID=2760705 RepID=UPI0020BE3110|nr:peptidoglycan DD-metalloendopeptidase family protein [Nocardioides sp. InS609-2]